MLQSMVPLLFLQMETAAPNTPADAHTQSGLGNAKAAGKTNCSTMPKGSLASSFSFQPVKTATILRSGNTKINCPPSPAAWNDGTTRSPTLNERSHHWYP